MSIYVDTTQPINKDYGVYQGVPIARHYIDLYIQSVREHISGRVLEFGSPTYAANLNCSYEILDINPDNRIANFHFDVCDENVPREMIERYDSIICTAVLQLVPSPAKAVQNMRAMLKAGGTLILAEKCLSKVDSWDQKIDRWRFMPNALLFLLREFSRVEVRSYGNVYAICAYLLGIPSEQVDPDKLHFVDPEHPLVAVAHATK